MSLPAISVVVSSFNGAKYLPRLLETLAAQQDVTLEIIVVDRQSTDGSADILASHPQVVVVCEPPQSGLVTGYAAGAAASRHPLIFFCNEDMWFAPDCLARLAQHVQAPDVAAVDPWQWTYDEQTVIHAGTRFERATRHQNGPDPSRRPVFSVPLASGDAIPFACASCLLIRRDVYDAVGGWDRSFFLDGEDLDLGIRIWQAGWRVVVEPAARVFHAVNVSNAKTLPGRVPVGRRRYESGRSSVLVMAVKYLPVGRCLWVGGLFLGSVALHALTGRREAFRWDLSALREFRRRLPGALAYRRGHREANRRRPVTKFFRAPEFQR